MKLALQPSFCRHKYVDLLAAGLLSYAISLIVSACDRVITGFYFGIKGLSALAVVDPLSSIIGFLGVIYMCGIRFVYPIEVGKKNQDRANQYFSCALTMSIIVSVVLLIVVHGLGNWYFEFQNISDEYLAYAQDYFLCAKFVFILQPITGLIGAVIFTDGDPRTCRIANVSYVVLNVIFSIIFAQFFGMIGIGLGTLAGGLVCFAIQCTHFFNKKNTLKYKPYLSLRDLVSMAKYGMSEAAYSIFSGFNGIIINWVIISTIGEAFLAVHSVVGYAMCLTCFFGGCQSSMVPILNVYLGEENRDGMFKILKVAMRFSALVGLIITAVVFIIAPVFPAMFSMGTGEFTAICISGIRVSCLSIIVTGILGVVTRYYNAIGRNALSTILSILKDSVVYMLLFAICVKTCGVLGMWLCNVLTPIVSAPLFYVIVRRAVSKDNPLGFPAQESVIKSWDLVLSKEKILDVRDQAQAYLVERNRSTSDINKVQLLIEEYGMMMLDNNSKKRIIMEITIIESAQNTRIIFRNSGELEDFTGEEFDATSFRAFFLSGLAEGYDAKEYMKISGYNRKEYVLSDGNADGSAAHK